MSEHLLLSVEERKRFTAWLYQEVHSHQEVAKQMDKLPHLEVIAKRERTRAAAKLLVARELESVEEMTIAPEPRTEGGG